MIITGGIMWLDEFKKEVLRNDGKISPKSVTEQSFDRKGKSSLWASFISNTAHLTSFTFTQRVAILLEGHLTVLPSCACGKPVRWADRKLSNTCSSHCANHGSDKAKKVSISKLSMDSSLSNNKREETMLKKYGVKFNSQRDDVKSILRKSTLNDAVLSKLDDKEWLNEEYNNKQRPSTSIADELGCFYGTVISFCRKHGFQIRRRSNVSKQEFMLKEFLTSKGLTVEHSAYPVDSISYEIDLYLPDFKLGIEIDGLKWHNEEMKDRNYHKNKNKEYEKVGIKLLHFTDFEVSEKFDIVCSMILHRLNLSSRKILARKSKVDFITSKEARIFLDKNHISGFLPSSIYVGLHYDNELVEVMTFSKPRFDKVCEWEIIRLSSSLDTYIVGGFSKMLSFFRTSYSGSIISYVDLRFGDGSSFYGFYKIRETECGYFWTDTYKQVSRYQAQKSNLAKWLKSFDASKTETENMQNAGFIRFWDCGNAVVIMD